jgi:ABC-type sugar transport system ATPase subunit
VATLTLQGLRKSFGPLEVIPGVDLDIGDREFVVLVGPSGCGKTTILRMIAGLEDASGGAILIDGVRVDDREPKDRDIAMVFQDYALYPHMTVAENIGFALRYRGVRRAEIRARVAAVAEVLDIAPLLARTPRQLSGGQRQRVAMGRAIVRDPKIFLFDEPLSNLDAKLRVQMRTELKKLRVRVPTTSVYVTHDQVEAMTLADRIVILNHGRIEQTGTPEEVYERPDTVFVAGFIGAPPMNLLPADAGPDGLRLADSSLLATTPLPPGVVWCGIRPEDVTWLPPDAPGTALIAASAQAVEPLGAETLVSLNVCGTDFAARLPPRTVRRAGELVRLTVDLDRLHLFDRNTGRRR